MGSFYTPEPDTSTSRAVEEPTNTPSGKYRVYIEFEFLSETLEITDSWLLHSSLSTMKGITVEIKGSFGDYESGTAGFAGGDYEGMHGVVLSVLNVSGDAQTSTGRVKLRDMPPGYTDIYVIPVAYLWPVPPSTLKDKAIVLHGKHKGSVVELREKLDSKAEDVWFVVSEDKSHQFEVEGSWLVGITDVAE